MRRTFGLSAVFLAALFTFNGCTGGNSPSSTPPQQTINPTPVITAVTPASLSAGSASQVVAIAGSGFVSGTVATFNGTSLQTTYSSATALQATVPANLLANGQTAMFSVTSPAPGGGSSGSVSFAVNAPAPVVTSLASPYVLQASSVVLLVTGSGFEANSSVLLNGTAHATNFLNATSLQVPLSATDTQTTGSVQLAVTNPGPGGSTSAASSFVVYPAPSITSITPATAPAGSYTAALTVSGSNFNANSVVQIDGVAQLTNFISASSLQVTVSSAALATGRVANVVVHNPAPTVADSAPTTLQITNPLPMLSYLQPNAIASGQAASVTIVGYGFEPTSSALWNGSARTTTYINSGALKIALTAADLQSAGTGQITVTNPAPGGGTSTALSLPVVTPPTATSLSPSSVQSISYNSTGTATVTITGTNFASGAYVIAGGNKLTPTSQSATQIVVAVPSNVLFYPGAVSVTVYNPGSNGTAFASQSLTLNVINPAATFSVTPNSAAIGSSAVTINLYGGGFFADSVVQWNGTALATKFLGNSSLSAVIPATLLTSLGTAVISVNTPENLGQTTPTQSFTTYVGLQVNDIVWNATDGLIYATVPGVVGQGLGNSLVGIDPNTGTVQKTIFVGSEPNRLAISTDGTQAFVGLDGARAFRQVNLSTATAGTQVSLGGGSGIYNPPFTALSLAAVPGQPNSVAVYASNGIVTIYDGTAPRAKTGGTTAYFNNGALGGLAFGADATTLYLANGSLNTYTVDGTGITATKSSTAVSGTALQYDKGRLYFNTGVFTDGSGNSVGQFSVASNYNSTAVPASGPVVSDSALNRAFVLVTNYSATGGLYAFDESTFNQVGSILLPTTATSYNNSTGDLIRWGQNGLAFHAGTQLTILQSAIVKDISSTPVDLTLSVQVPAASVTGTSFATQFQVTNSGPNSSAGTTLNFSVPASMIGGQVTTTQGTCSGTGTIFCDLGTLASSASATVTLNGTPTVAGSLQLTAVTSSQAFDSNTQNNQATGTTMVTGSGFNFTPTLAALSPKLIASGSQTVTLTATGSGFVNGSVVNWNGSALPTTFVSSTSLTAQVDSSLVKSLGWASVTVSSAAPGGGTSGTLVESIYTLLSLPANAMVYDPFTRKLWTVLPSTSTTPAGNSLVPLDPATATVGTGIQIGSEPNVLAETSSGNYLYIGISGAKSLGRFNLVTQKLDATIPLNYTSPYYGTSAVAANAVATLPGLDNSVSVPNVGIYDFSGTTATVRPNSTFSYADAVFPDSSHAYTYDNQSTGALFQRYTVDSSGAHLTDSTTLLGIGGFSGTIALGNGLVYGGAGGIINPLTTPPTQIAVLPLGVGLYTSSLSGGGAVPYSAQSKSFNIANNNAGTSLSYLERFDTQRFQLEDQLLLPTGSAYTQTIAGTRWGQDGLAYVITAGFAGNTPNQVMLLRGPFVLPSEASTNPAPTLTTVGLGAVVVGSGNQRINVTGTGFLPGASVIWNGVSHDTVYTNAQTLSVAVGAGELTTASTVSVTCRNPGSTDSNAVSVVIQ